MLRALVAVLLALVASDLLKIVTSRGAWRPFSLGGMPSSHTAIVAALAVAVWFEEGFSLLFLACGVYGVLVFRDAMGVRHEVTRHSAALNKLVKKGGFKVAGHTFLEASAGAVLGSIVAALVYLI